MRQLFITLMGMAMLAVPAAFADDVTPMDRDYGPSKQHKRDKPHSVTTRESKDAAAEGKDTVVDAAKAGAAAIFDEVDRRIISKYYGEHSAYKRDYDEYKDGHGKGKKNKKKGLPPGIAKKLERGGTMPPGIAKQYLPYDLERKLPPVPPGYERQVVGADVLLVETATGNIADIIADAVLGE